MSSTGREQNRRAMPKLAEAAPPRFHEEIAGWKTSKIYNRKLGRIPILTFTTPVIIKIFGNFGVGEIDRRQRKE